ncbi:SdiA-regulated domain-containing protein [Dyadobacter chenhuakuii]|uniref:SdiA-regulated domain-containing protein n=1 Tax=Dyadobacter chenhuakuii TaxID=2909339 RepID=A0A9X1Q7S1_9BACT|nr:SdiA-regulated domain-containing protein [Dyadobacter chenhuakuii]MCF2496725.1 SdiA-regulated domain-containing protein [Dyadobacter chenhuakuii]
MQNISKIAFIVMIGMILNCDTVRKRKEAETSGPIVVTSLTHYNLDKPEKFNMPESLLEISGIAFNDKKNDTVYAVNDEEGKVFRLGWNVPKQLHSKFSKQGDYEDVSIANKVVYVLKSNGVIYTFPSDDAIYTEVDKVHEIKTLLPKGEYEGLYADQFNNQLYVLCKKCDADYSWNTTTGYIIELSDSSKTASSFQINVKDIKQFKGKVKEGFRPSGLAKDPISGEWYIISAANKLLIVTDAKWNIKEAFPLSSNVFNQPEGIAFDKIGYLYISNEGNDLTNGNILKFTRGKP